MSVEDKNKAHPLFENSIDLCLVLNFLKMPPSNRALWDELYLLGAGQALRADLFRAAAVTRDSAAV